MLDEVGSSLQPIADRIFIKDSANSGVKGALASNASRQIELSYVLTKSTKESMMMLSGIKASLPSSVWATTGNARRLGKKPHDTKPWAKMDPRTT